ncbi:MAG: fumarylacetoacetate hydrolase family protein [Ignavibacteriaceae bacterium]|nr:fumarylacetoacetate hydrolase family protein [Ignavibacteriaceae bacterium]
MKLVSFNDNGSDRLGIFSGGAIINTAEAKVKTGIDCPVTLKEALNDWDKSFESLKRIESEYQEKGLLPELKREDVHLLSPVPSPASCRDGYAFRQHVATARRNRGVEMIPEFDMFPVFYFTNHHAVYGEGEIMLEDDHFVRLDFELECAIVISKKCRNIQSHEADKYIAGMMVMNDISARHLQMEEMKLNLGPAKGKDFATSFGPYLVTMDELEANAVNTEFGKKYNLRMTAYHNGKQVSEGNVADMNWTFAEIIERAAYGVTLQPGDIIGSGTVGTGCYLELNGTWALEAKSKNESFSPVWIIPGDTMELQIEGLGRLSNTFTKNPASFSLLTKYKKP